MSSQKTKNFNLHSWEGEDKFLRSEVNENFAALDSAVAETADTAQSNLNSVKNSLTSSINSVSATANGKTTVVTGSYTGNDVDNRTISLGFTPKAVLLMTSRAGIRDGSYYYGGLALENLASMAFSITSGGFTVRKTTNLLTNSSGETYCYLAVR